MFAIVENDKHFPLLEEIKERLEQRPSRLFENTERIGNRARHKAGVGYRREFDQPDAIVIPIKDAGSDFERQRRLADASCSDQRHEVACRKKSRDLRYVIFTTEECGGPPRQVVAGSAVGPLVRLRWKLWCWRSIARRDRFGDRADEAQSFPRDRPDELAFSGRIGDRLAGGVNTACEGRFRHDPPAPDRCDEIVLGDDAVAILYQIYQ